MMNRRIVLVMILGLVIAACSPATTESTTAAESDGSDTTAAPVTTEADTDQAESTTTTAAAAEEEEIVLQFSTASVPEDHHTQAIHVFADEVERLTGGSVKVEVFDSASLYDQTTEQTALLRGDLAMAYVSSQWLAERVPAASILTVPYMIQDIDHLYAVMDGRVGQEIFQLAVEQAEVRPITTLILGTRNLNLVDLGRRVMTPEDLAGVKLRVPDSPAWVRMGEALGANPTPIAFNEIYLALQTGTVDGQDNPCSLTRNGAFHEVSASYVLTGHVVNDVWPAISEKWWQQLSPTQQQAVVDAWMVARDEATSLQQDLEQECLEFLESEGLDVYVPDVEAFRNHVLDEFLGDESLTSTWIEGHFDIIQELGS